MASRPQPGGDPVRRGKPRLARRGHCHANIPLPEIRHRQRRDGAFAVVEHRRAEIRDAGRRITTGHVERLLRYCARPPLALDRLRERDREHLIYPPRNRAPAAMARHS